jgi:hypothetical protein
MMYITPLGGFQTLQAVTKRLRSGYEAVTKRLRSGYEAVTKWLRSGYDMK